MEATVYDEIYSSISNLKQLERCSFLFASNKLGRTIASALNAIGKELVITIIDSPRGIDNAVLRQQLATTSVATVSYFSRESTGRTPGQPSNANAVLSKYAEFYNCAFFLDSGQPWPVAGILLAAKVHECTLQGSIDSRQSFVEDLGRYLATERACNLRELDLRMFRYGYMSEDYHHSRAHYMTHYLSSSFDSGGLTCLKSLTLPECLWTENVLDSFQRALAGAHMLESIALSLNNQRCLSARTNVFTLFLLFYQVCHPFGVSKFSPYATMMRSCQAWERPYLCTITR